MAKQVTAKPGQTAKGQHWLYNSKLHKIIMPNLDFAIYFYVSLRQIYFFFMKKKVIGKVIDTVII